MIISPDEAVGTRCTDIISVPPTNQYVWINHTATFECVTKNRGYTLNLYIPGVAAEISSVPLLRGNIATATFKATLDHNGTNVTCGAMDHDFNLVCTSPVVHLHILGTFTIVPTTQHVWVNQTVTFECATNITGYTVTFDIPGVVEKILNYPLSDGGQEANASFTATEDLNGTTIKCGAFNGFRLIDTAIAHVYIKGQSSITNSHCTALPSYSGTNIFTITPTTQYVWINQTGTFECATNISEYNLNFNSSDDITLSTSSHPLAEGGQKAMGSFTAKSNVNGSIVQCGALDGFELVGVTEVAYALVQGPPSVYNLTATEKECGILCKWLPPDLLKGLSVSYHLYINEKMIQENISTTNYIYYPNITTSTRYNISVVAYNESVGDGPPVMTTVNFLINTTIIHNFQKTYKISQNQWIYQFELSAYGICTLADYTLSITAYSKRKRTQYTASTEYKNVTVHLIKDVLFIGSNMTLPEDDILNSTITIHSHKQTIVTVPFNISTHDLQHIAIVDQSAHKVCLEFTLADGATTDTVHIALESGNESSITEFKSSNNQKTFPGCLDVFPNKWLIKGCDGPQEDKCQNPAVTLPIVIYPTSTSYTITPSVLPTKKPSGIQQELENATIGLGIFSGLELIIIIILIATPLLILVYSVLIKKKQGSIPITNTNVAGTSGSHLSGNIHSGDNIDRKDE